MTCLDRAMTSSLQSSLRSTIRSSKSTPSAVRPSRALFDVGQPSKLYSMILVVVVITPAFPQNRRKPYFGLKELMASLSLRAAALAAAA